MTSRRPVGSARQSDPEGASLSIRMKCALPLLLLVLLSPLSNGADLHAQARTTMELGVGGVKMRNHDGWSGPIGIAAQLGVRRPVSGSLEARVGVLGFRRKPGDTGRRVTTVGLTAELAAPITPSGGVFVGGGVGLFAVDMYERGFDDAVRISSGAVGLLGTVGTRHAIGGGTIDLRLRVLYGDLGATGRTTVMLGVVVAP